MSLAYSTNSEMLSLVRGTWHVVYYDGEKTKLHNTQREGITEARKVRDSFYEEIRKKGAVDRSSLVSKIERNPNYGIVEQFRYIIRKDGKTVCGSNNLREARDMRNAVFLTDALPAEAS